MDLRPSDEQVKILDASETHNIIVNSVPGSGKSTTIYFLIEKYIASDNILILTYNRKLKDETSAKVSEIFAMEPIQPEVYTYHSFCQNKWKIPCHTDTGIRTIITKNLEEVDDIKYNTVVIDEAQDMSVLYFLIMKKIVTPTTRLILLGDVKQAIYGFNGADPRFLTLADKINGRSSRPFMHLTLSTSYRLSRPIAEFVNRCILGENRIVPSPFKLENYSTPIYVIDDFLYCTKQRTKKHASCPRYPQVTHGLKYFTEKVLEFLDAGYQPDDIFVLTPSAKAPPLTDNGMPLSNFNPVQHIAASLLNLKHKGEKVKIYIPDSDNEAPIDEDITRGKIVFCTYHRAKGLERKIVFVAGVDESYTQYYNKNSDPNECSNAMYVALTRATEHLIILHHNTRKMLECINEEMLDTYTTKIDSGISCRDKPSKAYIQYLFPSDATQHMRSEYIYNMMNMFEMKEVRKVGKIVNLVTKHKDDDNCEIVSSITSQYITFMHAIFNHVTRELEIMCDNIDHYKCSDPHCAFACVLGQSIYKFKKSDMMNPDCVLYNDKIIQYMLRLCTKISGIRSGYMHKFKQIKKYNWLTAQNVADLLMRLSNVLSDQCDYEQEIRMSDCADSPCLGCSKCFYVPVNRQTVKYSGRMDIVDHKKKNVWEIKCVQELKDEHCIQLLLYKYMCEVEKLYMDYKFYLLNIRTGEIRRVIGLKPQPERPLETSLREVAAYLVDKKYTPEDTENDRKFIEDHYFE